MISNININELLNMKNINIIDIRSIEKYNDNHIPNAINIPQEKILLNPNKYLDKNIRYYIYCQKGMSSYNICRILTTMGYKVTNINGGYESYIMNNRNQ
jgi:rhodanese-related sulfurtransferase